MIAMGIRRRRMPEENAGSDAWVHKVSARVIGVERFNRKEKVN